MNYHECINNKIHQSIKSNTQAESWSSRLSPIFHNKHSFCYNNSTFVRHEEVSLIMGLIEMQWFPQEKPKLEATTSYLVSST